MTAAVPLPLRAYCALITIFNEKANEKLHHRIANSTETTGFDALFLRAIVRPLEAIKWILTGTMEDQYPLRHLFDAKSIASVPAAITLRHIAFFSMMMLSLFWRVIFIKAYKICIKNTAFCLSKARNYP